MQPSVFPETPLRYPGAKKKVIRRLHPFLSIEHDEYREPFVGGGSVFFGKPLSQHSWINDADPDVAALFKAMKKYPEQLCDLVRSNPPTLALWDDLKMSQPDDELRRGFRTLFLNRTNYSGILRANPIGGRAQNPKYPIDCRWNPETLCLQIMACSRWLRKTKITTWGFDKVIRHPAKGRRVLLFLDPPYYHKGNSLYQVGMKPKEHHRLAQLLSGLDPDEMKFVLTYDDCPEVRELYSGWAHLHTEKWFYSTVKSTVKKRELGHELIVTNFEVPSIGQAMNTKAEG
ncbi:MAG TPA: DNA adenine methylase [Symbiobacteriaceae bacterium]|nr:DNA adenine methylase [Symbiobacteriaceae bacterium]